MVIENQINLNKKKKHFFFIGFIFITLISTSLMSDYFTLYLFPFPGMNYALFFLFVFVLVLIYRTFLDYNYIFFNNESDKIILRYHPLKFFTKDFNSIEISKGSFRDFEEN